MKNEKYLFWGMIVLFTVVTIILLYDAKMSNAVVIDKDTRSLTNFDLWLKYSTEKAARRPQAKSRSVMLLHAYVPFWNAGSEVCAHTVNKTLAQKGHEVWVGVPGYPNRVYEGVHMFDLNDRTLLHSLMKHTHAIGTHSFRSRCMNLSRAYGSAFIDWFHGGTYTSNANKEGIPKQDPRHWGVFNSNSLMESFNDVSENRIHILRPPVDWREYEVQKPNPRYITLSNLNENKGGQILIQIAKSAPELDFLGVRGSYWKQIEDHTVENITYINNTPRIKEVYAVTKILIMPSKDETWGRTAVEAMSSGIPVVAAPTPGLRECCEDAALFVERNDIKEWVRLIRRLSTDKAFYDEYANRGKARAKQLEPTHDLEMFMEWYEQKVVPSADPSHAKPPTFLEKYLDPM
jgi:glycosyltransferase involved in cell wall biosynthesis